MNEVILNSKNQFSPANIVFFEADVNYTIAHYNDGKKETFVKTLKHIEQKLNQHGFYRIHKSYLVNLEYIDDKPMGFDLELHHEYTLTISRRKLPGLRKQLKNKKRAL
jgi:two-component system, LytTR family, response regulator